jgi:hypothetical protein
MANLYCINTDWQYGAWENLSNWNTAADGSGSNPTNIPWTDDGNGGAWYSDYDLIDATGGQGININSIIDPNQVVTGSCNIIYVTSNSDIYGGTFTGDYFTNAAVYGSYGTIHSGLFTGSNFAHEGIIYGGTFTGDNFTIFGYYGGPGSDFDLGYIYDGTFSGNSVTSYFAQIFGGTFTGYNFYSFGSYINDGTFEIDGISINTSYQGYTTFPAINITSGGTPYTGEWLGQNWEAGVWVSAITFNLYYANTNNDATWDTLGNWWKDAEFAIPATALPSTGDTVYLYGNVYFAPSAPVTLNHIYVMSSQAELTNTTGDATFYGYGRLNGTVSGNATFNDSSITSYSPSGSVLGDATFNDSSQHQGSVSGNATFNDDSLIFYGVILGNATFNGNIAFTNQTITGTSTFSIPAAIFLIGGLAGFDGEVLIDAPSGGGSDQTIARLLNLPWFINL